jgi:hypothetical protein
VPGQKAKLLGIPGLEAGIVWVLARDAADDVRKGDGRQDRAHQRQFQQCRVQVTGDLARGLAAPEVREVLPLGAVGGGAPRSDGLAGKAGPQQQAAAARVSEGGVVGDHVRQGLAGIGDRGLLLQPALLQGPVQPLFAAEVVRDQLLIQSRPPGDGADPGAGIAVRGELVQRGGDQPFPRPLGVPLPLLGSGRTTRLSVLPGTRLALGVRRA